MTIYNDTDRVITVYNDTMEESIGCGKNITVEDDCFSGEQVLCVRYFTLKEMKTGVESGWDHSTFGKKLFYYWFIRLQYPIQCRIRYTNATEIHISSHVEDIPTLLFPHMTVKKLNCQAEQGKSVAVEHFFSSGKERRMFLTFQWVKSIIWTILSFFWLIGMWKNLQTMNGATEVLLNGVFLLLLALIPIVFLIPNLKYLCYGIKWGMPNSMISLK